MNYIIIPKDSEPFITDYYTDENCFIEGMTVINLNTGEYTQDGKEWKELEQDHL